MKLTSQWFLTADTHFDHDKLITFGRPYDFNQVIIENWNRVVGEKDSVLHLGDLTMANKEKTIQYTKQLKGLKYLIRGNHDQASDSWYHDCGFTVIEPIFKTIKDDFGYGRKFLFTHIPVTPIPEGFFNIHGHLHGNSHRGTVPNDHQYYDVGVDCTDFTPIKLSEVVSRLLPVDKPTS